MTLGRDVGVVLRLVLCALHGHRHRLRQPNKQAIMERVSSMQYPLRLDVLGIMKVYSFLTRSTSISCFFSKKVKDFVAFINSLRTPRVGY